MISSPSYVQTPVSSTNSVAMENNREHNTLGTTHVHVGRTYAITAEQQQFPPLDFNIWGWPYWPKHAAILRTFNNFKVLKILNVNL
jgi:hypothetical protein